MKRTSPTGRYRVDFKVRALAALDANDGRMYLTARQLEVPRSTLRTWAAHRDDIHLEVEKQRGLRALLLEDRFGMMIEQIANTMLERIDSMKPLDSIRAVKMLLDLNESVKTKRVAEEKQSSDVYAKLARLIERYRPEDHASEAPVDEEAKAEPLSSRRSFPASDTTDRRGRGQG